MIQILRIPQIKQFESAQDTLDSSKPMKKRGLKSDITDEAISNPPEQISPGKLKL